MLGGRCCRHFLHPQPTGFCKVAYLLRITMRILLPTVPLGGGNWVGGNLPNSENLFAGLRASRGGGGG
jgi:hypothetical protein